MRFKKKFLFLLFFFIFVGIYMFSPLDFYVQLYVNRFFSSNPIPIEERERTSLTSYEWTLKDLEGHQIQVNDIKNRVVLINFWATWCPPCIVEMPDFQKLYDDYGDKMTFLFVARDREDRVVPFLKKKAYHLPVYYESGLTPKELFNLSLPTTYIIDKKGTIVVAKVGFSDWNSDDTRSILDKLLKE